MRRLVADGVDAAAYAYVLAAFVFLTANLSPGLHVTDEGVYLLMADSMADGGALTFWNGPGDSVEYEFTEVVHLVDGRIAPQYPPLYSLLAVPFYPLSTYGLIALNSLAFCGTILLIYHISDTLFSDKLLSLAAGILYSAFTYAPRYALGLWPHSLVVFLVAASVYAALKGVGGDARYLAAAGFLSAYAAGVRYPAAVYGLVLLLYVAAEAKAKAAYYVVGGAAPLLAMVAMNYAAHGSILPWYRNLTGDFGFFSHYQVFTLGFILLAGPYLAWRLGRGDGLKVSAATAAASAAAMYFLDPSFMSHMVTSLQVMFAEVVDMGFFPAAAVPEAKKSLLQAAPMLALAAAGLIAVRRNRKTYYLLLMLALSSILFYSMRVHQHGGNTPYMRYFLESLPYLSLLSAYAVRRLYGRPGHGWSILLFGSLLAFIILFYVPLLASQGRFLVHSSVYGLVFPLTLSAALLVAYPLVERGIRYAGILFTILLLITASYTVVNNIISVTAAKSGRGYTAGIAEELGFIEEGSTVVYFGDFNILYLAPVKADREVVLVNAARDGMRDTVDVIGRRLHSGPVYVVEGLRENYAIETTGFNNGTWEDFVDGNITEAFQASYVWTDGLVLLRLNNRPS